MACPWAHTAPQRARAIGSSERFGQVGFDLGNEFGHNNMFAHERWRRALPYPKAGPPPLGSRSLGRSDRQSFVRGDAAKHVAEAPLGGADDVEIACNAVDDVDLDFRLLAKHHLLDCFELFADLRIGGIEFTQD